MLELDLDVERDVGISFFYYWSACGTRLLFLRCEGVGAAGVCRGGMRHRLSGPRGLLCRSPPPPAAPPRPPTPQARATR